MILIKRTVTLSSYETFESASDRTPMELSAYA